MTDTLDFKNLDRYFHWQASQSIEGKEHLKFSRRFILPTREIFYGLESYFCKSTSEKSPSCDILMLHPSKRSMELGRKNALIHRIREMGLSIIETYVPTPKEILKTKQLAKPPIKIPARYRLFATYAYFLVNHYQAKIILTEMNGSKISPFLRYFQKSFGKVAHLAHAILMPSSRRNHFMDFDYYFIYGQSSLEFLQAQTIRYGSTKVILAGSYLFDESFTLEPADVTQKTFLLLGSGPDYEKTPDTLNKYQWLKNWIEKHADYQLYVKPHPRSTSDFWREAASTIKNIQVFPGTFSFVEALKPTSFVIADYTNAIIDAASLKRPPLIFTPPQHDFFSYQQFFGSYIHDEISLDNRIRDIFENYSAYLEKTRQFADYHLAKQQDSVEFITECLRDIINGSDNFCWIEMKTSE